MSNILILPTKLAAEEAWERYAVLCREMMESPALADDPDHTEARKAAHEDFTKIFLAMGAK